MSNLYYLSFADPQLPEGSQWLGGAYVSGEDGVDVVQEAHRRGCNPGGEVEIAGPLPEGAVPDAKIGVLLDRSGIELDDA